MIVADFDLAQLRGLLAGRGVDLTEALCFGLGSGLGFSARSNVGLSRTFNGCSTLLANDLVHLLGVDVPLAELIPSGVQRAGAQMLAKREGSQGIAGLEAFVKDLPDWPALADFEACAAEGHAVIEERSPGGGLFRVLMAQFLDEAQRLRPELALRAIAHGYRELAWEWGELATAMKLAAKDRAWDGLPRHAQNLLEHERELAERLAGIQG